MISDEAHRIAKLIGETPLFWAGVGYDEPSHHWGHGYEAGCAICKAGASPACLKILIDRVLELHAEGSEG